MIPEIKKILYATDLSSNSVYALRYAVNSAIRHNADIIILHVIEKGDPANDVMLDLYLYSKRYQEIVNEHIVESSAIVENRLSSLIDKELKNHPEYADKVKAIEVCEGFLVEKILSKAEELNCDEIIMGTHSKGIIANTFFGSTAKRVLRRTRKPVFIIPLPKKEADIGLGDI